MVVHRDVVLIEDPAEESQKLVESQVLRHVCHSETSADEVLGNVLLMLRLNDLQFVVAIDYLADVLYVKGLFN